MEVTRLQVYYLITAILLLSVAIGYWADALRESKKRK